MLVCVQFRYASLRLRLVFEAWASGIRSIQLRMTRVLRVAGRLHSTLLARAITQWRQWSEASRRCTNVLEHVMRRRGHVMLLKALPAWYAYATSARTQRRMLAQGEQQAALGVLRLALLAWRDAWSSEACWKASLTKPAAQHLLRFTLGAWAAHCASARVERNSLGAAVRHLRHVSLLGVWRGWCVQTGWIGDQHRGLKLAAHKLQTVQLAEAWNICKRGSTYMIPSHQILLKALYLGAWACAVSRQRMLAAALHRNRAAQRQQRVALGAALHMWQAWAVKCSDSPAGCNIKASLRRARHIYTTTSLYLWNRQIVQRRVLHTQLQRAARRERALGTSLTRWRWGEFTTARRREHTAARRRSTYRVQSVSSVFRAWSGNMESNTIGRTRTLVQVQRARHATRVFAHWLGVAQAARYSQGVLRMMRLRSGMRTRYASFEHWAAWCSQQARFKSILAHAQRCRAAKFLSISWKSWVGASSALLAYRLKLELRVRRERSEMVLSCLVRAWDSWRLTVLTQLTGVSKGLGPAERQQIRMEMHRSLLQWVSFVRSMTWQRGLYSLNQIASAQHKGVLLARTLRAWHLCWQRANEARRAEEARRATEAYEAAARLQAEMEEAVEVEAQAEIDAEAQAAVAAAAADFNAVVAEFDAVAAEHHGSALHVPESNSESMIESEPAAPLPMLETERRRTTAELSEFATQGVLLAVEAPRPTVHRVVSASPLQVVGVAHVARTSMAGPSSTRVTPTIVVNKSRSSTPTATGARHVGTVLRVKKGGATPVKSVTPHNTPQTAPRFSQHDEQLPVVSPASSTSGANLHSRGGESGPSVQESTVCAVETALVVVQSVVRLQIAIRAWMKRRRLREAESTAAAADASSNTDVVGRMDRRHDDERHLADSAESLVAEEDVEQALCVEVDSTSENAPESEMYSTEELQSFVRLQAVLRGYCLRLRRRQAAHFCASRVRRFLKQVGLSRHWARFEKHGITIDDLMTLSGAQMKVLGLVQQADRARLMKNIELNTDTWQAWIDSLHGSGKASSGREFHVEHSVATPTTARRDAEAAAWAKSKHSGNKRRPLYSPSGSLASSSPISSASGTPSRSALARVAHAKQAWPKGKLPRCLHVVEDTVIRDECHHMAPRRGLLRCGELISGIEQKLDARGEAWVRCDRGWLAAACTAPRDIPTRTALRDSTDSTPKEVLGSKIPSNRSAGDQKEQTPRARTFSHSDLAIHNSSASVLPFQTAASLSSAFRIVDPLATTPSSAQHQLSSSSPSLFPSPSAPPPSTTTSASVAVSPSSTPGMDYDMTDKRSPTASSLAVSEHLVAHALVVCHTGSIERAA